MKKKIIFSALGVILLTPVLSTGVVLADTLTNQESVVVNNNDLSLNVREGETVTLQQIVDSLNVTPQEKEEIIAETLKYVNANNINAENRNMRAYSSARMSTVIKRLSPSQVKKAANTNDWIGYLTGLAPRVGIPLGAIYMLNGQTLRTAADHGWGLEVVFTADPNNPTSTGMSFSWRYVK